MAKNLTADAQNTPSADDTIKLFIEAERLKGKVDEANGKLCGHLKLMDERGINLKAIAMLRKLRRMDTDEATMLMRDVSRMGRWLQFPVFSQPELFGSDDAAEPSTAGKQAFSEHEADQEGFAAGKAGRAANDCRFELGSAEFIAFGQGWVRGQAVIAAQMTDDLAKKAEARAAGGRRPGRRKKDEAAGAEA